MAGKQKSGENPHKKHRERMRAKLRKGGSDAMQTHELLEMLLYFTIYQKNTNEIAHDLLEEQSLLRLLESDPADMQKVDGVGPVSARLIQMTGTVARRAVLEELTGPALENDFQRCLYLYTWYRGKPASTVTALLLDREHRVIENAVLSQGRTMRPDSYEDLIVSAAEKYKAAGVILAHNHANNVREASIEDMYLTGCIRKALDDTSCAFLGHYIVTGTDCFICPEV